MYEVTVQDTFSSGHYLRDYYGKCENPHGHNYRVLVTLIGEQLDAVIERPDWRQQVVAQARAEQAG